MSYKILIGVVALCLLTACRNDQGPSGKIEVDNVKGLPLPEVKVNILEKQGFSKELISNGKLQVYKKAEARFRISERITAILVKNGQRVKKGELIATLESFEIKNQYLQNKIDFEAAKISLTDYLIGQGYSIADSSTIPAKIMETAKIKSGYAKAQSELDLAQEKLNATRLRAPISGFIAGLEIEENNWSGTSEPLCMVIDNSAFYVNFPVMETELDLIGYGQEVIIEPVSSENTRLMGIIGEINPIVDQYGFVNVKAIIRKVPVKLFDGMNAKVYVKKTTPGKLVIPKSAVTYSSEKPVVFIYEKGLAKWNYVVLGDENSSHFTIEKGLNEGDSVIIEGVRNLAHDTKVILEQ